jgi:hypothetical protein
MATTTRTAKTTDSRSGPDGSAPTAPLPRQRGRDVSDVIDLDAAPAADLDPEGREAFDLPTRWRIQVSGTYTWSQGPFQRAFTPVPIPVPAPEPLPVPGVPHLPQQLPHLPNDRLPIPVPQGPFRLRWRNEELRVDVDGWYPQNVISGSIASGLSLHLDWIAHVARTPAGTWAGSISYRNGDNALLPQTDIEVSLRRSLFTPGTATVTFSGGGAASFTRVYAYSASSFHPVQFEYDVTSDSNAITTFDTATHANRPADLPLETLSIESVYRRTGFAVTTSGGGGVVPVSAAGPDSLWTDQELNDAMAVYWSAYSTSPRWAAWALFAGQNIRGSSLGGIMFDYSGAGAQRQGCAIFSNSFISTPPAGDPQAAAFVNRMRFWTACHELGHTFNLAHAWDKPAGSAWIPTADESGLFSFMNYPYRYSPGGTTAFFNSFRYRFTDSELLFVRHAPQRFVEQANALWFDQHGFQQAAEAIGSPLTLQVRAHRPSSAYEYLEPVTLELKLTNTGEEPLLLDDTVLEQENLTVVIARQGHTARRLVPFTVVCRHPRQVPVQPGESVYGSITVSAGRDGWEIADPGDYAVCVALHLADQDVVAAPHGVRVLPPTSREEELLGQDLLSPEVGRVLAAGGTRRSSHEADVLREVAERLDGRAVARHARFALGQPMQHEAKQLSVETTAYGVPVARSFETRPADPAAAASDMGAAVSDIVAAADTFGHIATRKRVKAYADALAATGKRQQAVKTTERLRTILSERGVKDDVLADIAGDQAALAARKS